MYQPQSITHQLADHIKKNLNKGYTEDSLKYSLMNQGYSRITIERAIEIANKELAETAPIMKEKPQITLKIIDTENQNEEISIERIEKKSIWQKIFGE